MTTIIQNGKKVLKLMEIRGYQKIYYLIYEIFYTNLIVTTKQKIGAKSQITNKEKTEKPSQKTTKLKWQTEIQGKNV